MLLNQIINSLPCIDNNNTIFFATTTRVSPRPDTYLYAVNNYGILQWKYPLESYNCSPVIDSNGNLYVGQSSWAGGFVENTLFAFDQNSSFKWDFNAGGNLSMTSPAVGADGSIFFVNSSKLFSVSKNGMLNWDFNFFTYSTWGGYVKNGLSIGPDGTIYITSQNNGYIVAVNPDSTEKWRVHLKGTTHMCWPAIATDGTIYISTLKMHSDTTRFFALNPDGSIKWKIDRLYIPNPIIDAEGTIYGGSFHAINPDGSMKWSSDIGYSGYTCD